jgi:outer membrane protein assembly factor BamB/predicted phosphodiesterase
MRGKRLALPAALAALLFLCVSAETPALRFAVVADIHFGAPGADAGWRTIVANLKAAPGLRFVVLNGDLTEKGSDEEFAALKAGLAGLAVPVYALPGNHDLHWLGWGGQGFQSAFGASRFAFREAGTSFVGMNAGDLGHFAPDDLEWLAESLRRIPAAEDVVFFVHQPPSMIDNWNRVRALLSPRRTLVIAGHVHAEAAREEGGVPLFTVRAALAGAGRPGFDIFEIGSEEVTAAADSEGPPPSPWGRIAKSAWKGATAAAVSRPAEPAARVLWQFDLKSRLLAAPVTDGKHVFLAGLSGRLVGLDLKGRVLWTREGRSAFLSRPAVFKKLLYAASVDGRLVKLDAATGVQTASTEFGRRFTSPLLAYEDEQVKVPRLLAGTSSGHLLCVNLFNLTDVWTSDAAKGAIQSRPLATEGKAVFGAWDGAAHAVDLQTGREIWRWTENDNFFYSPAGASPAGAKGRVFLAGPDGFVSAVDAGTGRTAWRTAADAWESLSLSTDGRKVLVKGRQGGFAVLDAGTGAVLQKVERAHAPGDLFPVEPLEAAGRILYGGQDGKVYVIGPDGQTAHPVLDFGPGAVHTILALGKGLYLAANVDGKAAAFELPKETKQP